MVLWGRTARLLAPPVVLALAFAASVTAPAVLAASPSLRHDPTSALTHAVVQGGRCNAFSGAHQLAGSGSIKPAAYTDSSVVVPACGPLPGNQSGKPWVKAYPGGLNIPGYQCVEFSERYLYYRFGATMAIPTNGDEVVANYVAKYPSEFSSIANMTVGQAPVQGDVLSISTAANFKSRSGGHTAVVQSSAVNSSGTGTVTIVEENASAAPSGVQTLKITAWKVAVKGYAYVKWLAPKSAQPTWSIVASPNQPSQDNVLLSVSCVSASFCVAVGYNGAPVGVQTPLIEQWNGTTWSIANSPNPTDYFNQLSGVSCVSTKLCFAVGNYGLINSSGVDLSQALVERWDGTSWSIVTVPDQPTDNYYHVFLGVSCASASFCVAAGYYGIDSSNEYENLVEQWNGTNWNVVSSPNNGADDQLSDVSCVSANFCVADGYYFGSTSNETLIEQWNGTIWSIVSSPNPYGDDFDEFYGVSCVSASFCVATGAGVIAQWNGSSWGVVSWSSPSFGYLGHVSCSSTSVCTAVGSDQPSSYGQTLVEQWDGTNWSATSSPNTGIQDGLNGVSCPSAGFCVAVGNYDNGTNGEDTLIEQS